jgi:hypothetical protein
MARDPDKLYSALSDLEPSICDLVLMANIATQLAFDPLAPKTGDQDVDEARKRAHFAICHVADMAEALKQEYYARHKACGGDQPEPGDAA